MIPKKQKYDFESEYFEKSRVILRIKSSSCNRMVQIRAVKIIKYFTNKKSGASLLLLLLL